jgi:glycerate-2-kinase
MSTYIYNIDSLASTPLRKDALSIVEAAYEAIDTHTVLRKHVTKDSNTLTVAGHVYDLSAFNHVYLIGIGKASYVAVTALEDILGDAMTSGIVIDKSIGEQHKSSSYKGDHPLPTVHNVELSEKVADLARSATEHDLVIVVISGGGSSLFCYPMSECEQGNILYEKFLTTGGSISELNTLRKHISSVKGGGLAQMLYPATVASLIFSDVPGDAYDFVASGPTYKDTTTVLDAEALLAKYGIENTFSFNETPKDAMYFEKITNIPLVSNIHAVEGMKEKAQSLGYNVIVQSTEEYREASIVLAEMKACASPKTAVIVAGEPSVVVEHGGDKSGRNEYAGGKALLMVEDGEVFVPFATDGIDNRSEAAGVIVDSSVLTVAKEKGVHIESYLDEGKHDALCRELGIQIITGPTGSNVSDCILYLRG